MFYRTFLLIWNPSFVLARLFVFETVKTMKMEDRNENSIYFGRDTSSVSLDLINCAIHDDTFMCVMEACEGKSFPSRLWHLLSKNHELNKYIHWSEDGNSIIIPCEEKNSWPEMVFQHPDFKRGQPMLLDRIKRRCNVKKSRGKKLFQHTDVNPSSLYLANKSSQLKNFIVRCVPHEDQYQNTDFHNQMINTEPAKKKNMCTSINELFEGQSFPYRLFFLVSESHRFENVINWSFDGSCIEIPSQLNFLNKVLLRRNQKIFKTESMKSFVRQLNLYGFRKVQVDKQNYMRERHSWPEAVFAHPFFQKGRADLLDHVKRRVHVKLKYTCPREYMFYPNITDSYSDVLNTGQEPLFSFPQYFSGDTHIERTPYEVDLSYECDPPYDTIDANSAVALQFVLESFCEEMFEACESNNCHE
ncbi:uncharacterized protein LOC101240141 isoform X5 [Hydra vulgaris]|uniref:Uncharacterized protein LOC101240141 isoform X5 n=2 Tax=Hydra vulgaris TaxID=6087 RepID=A0ABM4CTN9_HYDVU